MDPLFEEEAQSQASGFVNPVTFVLEFLSSYGWLVVGGVAAAALLVSKLRPHYYRWKEAREDAQYHKDPDRALARAAAVQRAREQQQRRLEAASERALQEHVEREERRRADALERLEKYGASGRGRTLGTTDDGYLPLSGGASTSSYRAPKRSACSGGGCGR